MQQKIEWVNALKTIGILAVILGHIASPWGQFIFSWHMPLFFLVAGFFIKFDLDIKSFLIKDFKRLLAPYFIFTLFALVVTIAKVYVLHRPSLDYGQELLAIFFWMNESSLMHTYGFVLWFLPALFLARFFLYLIKKYIKFVLIQVLIVVALFIISFYITLPFALDKAFNAVIWVFLGNTLMRLYRGDREIIYFLSFVFVIGIFVFYGVPSLNMAAKYYVEPVINLLWAASFVTLLVFVLKSFNYNKELTRFINSWGGNTMILFIIEPYTNNIASIFVEKIHFGNWSLKFLISLIILQCLLLVKQRYERLWIFKYV